MPVYHDDDGNNRRIFVGVDQGTQHLGNLAVVGSRGDAAIRHGTLADGVGHSTVHRYLGEALGSQVRRYSSSPEVRVIGYASPDDMNRIVAAVRLVNAALPVASRLRVGTPLPNLNRRSVAGMEMENTIYIEFNRDRVGGTTWNTYDGNRITNSFVELVQPGGRLGHRNVTRDAVILTAHELLHALGLGHVSPDFDTIMDGVGGMYELQQGIPLPRSLLYPLDREAVRALYGRLENGDNPTNFGPWASTSLHIHGNGPHAGFGVALRNGYAEPYAYGYKPAGAVDDSVYSDLTGRVTYEGQVVGFSPTSDNWSAVAGDARIYFNLDTLTGRADFTNLEAWADTPGEAGSGVTWGDGDLGYSLAVRGNTFKQTGGDEGTLTGAFTGFQHEGVAGILERQDLTAAFGAAR